MKEKVIFNVIVTRYEDGKMNHVHYVSFASLKGAHKYLDEAKDRCVNVLGWKCKQDFTFCDDELQDYHCYRYVLYEMYRVGSCVHTINYKIEKNILHD